MRTSPLRSLLLVVALVLPGLSAAAASLSRGPFLQQLGPTSVVVALRTSSPAVARIRYGASPSALGAQLAETLSSTQHALALSGLSADTTYFYAVDLDGVEVLGGPALHFHTAPPTGTPAFRFFVFGGPGQGDAHQQAVAARMLAEPAPPAFLLQLGDLAADGADGGLDAHFFQPYAPLLATAPVWPTPGELEAGGDGGAYLDAFMLPTNGAAPNEGTYAFTYANALVISLDTELEPFGGASAQLGWAQTTLQNSSATWKLVFFHRPPYSGGGDGGDPGVQAVVPLLEASGADVVFSGHTRVYERSHLLQGGGVSVASTDGGYDKGPSARNTLYLVSDAAGPRGALADPSEPHLAVQQGNVSGVEVIDIASGVLRGYFLDESGAASDLFALRKAVDAEPPVVLGVRAGPAPTEVRVEFNEPVQGATASGSAEAPARYSISPPVTVTSAALGSDLRTVLLTTQPHAAGSYQLTVSGVADRAAVPNTLSAASPVSYAFVADGGTPGADAGGCGSCGGTLPGGGGPDIPDTPKPGCGGCSTGGIALLGVLSLVLARRR